MHCLAESLADSNVVLLPPLGAGRFAGLRGSGRSPTTSADPAPETPGVPCCALHSNRKMSLVAAAWPCSLQSQAAVMTQCLAQALKGWTYSSCATNRTASSCNLDTPGGMHTSQLKASHISCRQKGGGLCQQAPGQQPGLQPSTPQPFMTAWLFWHIVQMPPARPA